MRGRGGVSHSVPELEVPVAGGSLATFELCGGGDQQLPVVIAAHGITANSRAWVPVARELGGRVQLLAPDLRGRGRSNKLPGPYGMARHAADLLALADALGVQRAVFVGHSNGAYIVARLAADHPERVHAAILVDGGLTIPGLTGVDPQEFVDAFLGPALARLKMTYPAPEAYREWWRGHPALGRGDVLDADLVAYADHDLVGDEPALRSAVSEDAVRGDAGELFEMGAAAHRMTVPATFLCAPRGLQDQPSPMQPLELVQAWADEAPDRRRAVLVPDVNHYTITLGQAGARAVAGAIIAAAATVPASG
jgi:pimeloyl-ACP methyl ester carboxylesterase